MWHSAISRHSQKASALSPTATAPIRWLPGSQSGDAGRCRQYARQMAAAYPPGPAEHPKLAEAGSRMSFSQL